MYAWGYCTPEPSEFLGVIPVRVLCWEQVPVCDVADCRRYRKWSLNLLIKALSIVILRLEQIEIGKK